MFFLGGDVGFFYYTFHHWMAGLCCQSCLAGKKKQEQERIRMRSDLIHIIMMILLFVQW